MLLQRALFMQVSPIIYVPIGYSAYCCVSFIDDDDNNSNTD